ncbi:GNAT family N-acetyltransferase [Bacillus sp. SG-1]|uniref:GNAT family N-acetyltransferase n=1 Tax=Bacillus sp. SG-1 TaxID=161544 RepID=UPI0001543208|nr:GNAT family protein [Bacillus sp. SG-1]EDL66274.1 ribosomal-protein-serine N-acetyltransferase [Bacillus sp. SG-1]
MFKIELDGDTYISLLQPHHAVQLFKLVDANRENLGKWLSFPQKTKSVADSKTFIEKSLTRFANDNGFWAGIWSGSELAGAIGFIYVDSVNRKAEIGYWLGNDFEGRGLVTRSCKCFIQHAFEKWTLNKVEINMASGNIQSRAVAERLGFKQEGIIRDYEFLNGEYHNRVIYGMLQKEWMQRVRVDTNEENGSTVISSVQ